jgi:hypothetical protein
VIEDFGAALEDGTLSSSKAKELKSKALGYFQNNRDRMTYDKHLAKGLPIASGIIESTCNSLINIRMEGAGMSWSTDGALDSPSAAKRQICARKANRCEDVLARTQASKWLRSSAFIGKDAADFHMRHGQHSPFVS